MAYCGHCGKEIDEKAVIGVNCGCPTNNNGANVNNGQTNEEPSNSNNMMSIVGFVTSCISLLINFWGAVGIGGIIVSTIGLVNSKKLNGAGKGLAISGIIIGAISVLYALVTLSELGW